MSPFKPDGVSVFNSFVVGKIGNAFITNLMVLSILIQLDAISQLILYQSPTINKRSLDRYIIFSRICSISGLLRLFRGLEWPSKEISTCPCSLQRLDHQTINNPDHGSRDAIDSYEIDSFTCSQRKDCGTPNVSLRYSKLVVPCLIRTVVLCIQLGAIYCGSNVQQKVVASAGFDARLEPNVRDESMGMKNESGCDNYIENSRGMEQIGQVLKCVRRSQARHFQVNQKEMIVYSFKRRFNSHVFEITSAKASTIRISLHLSLNLVNGKELQIAPLRPDLNPDHSTKVFIAVLNRTLVRVGEAIRADVSVMHSDSYGDVHMSLSQSSETDSETVATALVGELRLLSLGPNSTGFPWVFDGDGKYILYDDAEVAILGINPVANGTLLIIAAFLFLIKTLLQRWWVVFDEAAYLATKYMLNADLRLGPTVVKEMSEPLQVNKFSNGVIGHIGFKRMNLMQVEVHHFSGCEMVL